MNDPVKLMNENINEVKNDKCSICESKKNLSYFKSVKYSIISGLALAGVMYLGIIIVDNLLESASYSNISYESVLKENVGTSSFLVTTFVLIVGLSLAFISDSLCKKYVNYKYMFEFHSKLLKLCDLLTSYLLCMSIFIFISWSNVNIIFIIWFILFLLISPSFAWVREKNKNSPFDLLMYGMVSILFFIGIAGFTYFHENFSCEGKFLCGLV